MTRDLGSSSETAEDHYKRGLALAEAEFFFAARQELKQAIRKRPDFAEAHFALASNYRNLGQINRAIKAYRATLEIKPDFVEACRELALTYDYVGCFMEALKLYAKAILLSPQDAELRNDLAKALHEAGRYEEAIMAHRQALQIEPSNRRANFFLGLIYVDLNDAGSALQAVEQLKTFGHADAASQLLCEIRREFGSRAQKA